MGPFPPLAAFKILFFVSYFKQFHSDVTKCGLLRFEPNWRKDHGETNSKEGMKDIERES